jgi:competence protein ComEC
LESDNTMTLITFSIAWLLGIWLGSLQAWPAASWLAGAALSACGLLLARRWPRARPVLLVLMGLGLGAVRYATAVPLIDAAHIASYNDGESIILTGLVVDEPDVRDRFVNVRVAVASVAVAGGGETAVTGLVLIRAPRFPVIAYGSRIQASGVLETPPDDPGFSYKAYLARQGIHSLMGRPFVAVLATGQGNPVYQAIFALKGRAQAIIARLIPEPEAALLTGILLGNDNGLPPALAEAFRLTGMTHIIAISGFNISLLIALMVSAGQPRRRAGCRHRHFPVHRARRRRCLGGAGRPHGRHLPGRQSLVGTADLCLRFALWCRLADDSRRPFYPVGCRLPAQLHGHAEPDALCRSLHPMDPHPAAPVGRAPAG